MKTFGCTPPSRDCRATGKSHQIHKRDLCTTSGPWSSDYVVGLRENPEFERCTWSSGAWDALRACKLDDAFAVLGDPAGLFAPRINPCSSSVGSSICLRLPLLCFEEEPCCSHFSFGQGLA